jgi:hypothetical protein
MDEAKVLTMVLLQREQPHPRKGPQGPSYADASESSGSWRESVLGDKGE